MPTGMEMMVNSILKASGVDPEKMKEDIVRFGKELQEKIASLDRSMKELRDEQRAMREILMEGTYTKVMERDGPPSWDIKGTPLGDKFKEAVK